jgi:hypothetical protein
MTETPQVPPTPHNSGKAFLDYVKSKHGGRIPEHVVIDGNDAVGVFNARTALLEEQGMTFNEASESVCREFPAVAAACGLALDADGTVVLAESTAPSTVANSPEQLRTTFQTLVGNLTSATGPRVSLYDACARVLNENARIAAAMGLVKAAS